jgi:hypothetical protein
MTSQGGTVTSTETAAEHDPNLWLMGQDKPPCGAKNCRNKATRVLYTNYGPMGQLCDQHYAEAELTLEDA